MAIGKDYTLLPKAKALRRELTPHERKLWYCFLRTYPVKIYKQRIIGPYIADFYCASAGLVIELDGSQHYEPAGRESDQRRDQYMEQLGLQILRFSNREIDREFRAVCEMIDGTIREKIGK
ncbi:MAG: endonuclease domain-containing protein [Oscillospiraceae bacterium]|nr:endonuclease domain-containing protein [Oscillospiraceae bacterium]